MAKTLLTFLAAGCITISAVAGPPAKSPSIDNLRVHGIMMYDNSKNQEILGEYSYNVTAPVKRRALQLVPRMYAAGNTIIKDGKAYTYMLSVDYGYVNSAKYYVVDLSTGAQTAGSNITYDLTVAYSHFAASSALNPVDGSVYVSGYEYDATAQTLTPYLKTWDLAADTKTAVGKMQAPLIAMAFDAKGNLYGITSSSSKTSADGGYLVKVDTATGNLTNIGDTGVRPYFDQSAAIDPESGIMYWFANLQDESANLYSVNLATAKTTLISPLPDGDEVVAAYFPKQTVNDAAPSAVTGLALQFDGGNLSGKIKFTVPEKNYAGNTLDTNELKYTVKANGATVAEAATTAGAVVADVEVAESANYTFSVTLTNKHGESLPEEASAYIGYDVPAAIASVALTRDDITNTLTWDAPATGINNGYLNPSELRYRIVRSTDSKVVAETHEGTTFTEVYNPEELSTLTYTVTPVNNGIAGASTKSNGVTVGSALIPPYSQDFTDDNSFSLFTAIDANKDNVKWTRSVKSARYSGSRTMDADDYLVLPPLKLIAGNSYELSFDCYGINASYTNIFDIAIGTAPTAEALADILLADVKVSGTSRAPINTKVNIKPASDGVYYIAVHLRSDKNQSSFTVDNIKVGAGVSTAIPAAASEITVTPGEKGALNAKVAFTAPTLTSGSAPLASITKIEISRDGKSIATVNDAVVGKAYSINDNVTASGEYTYSVVCHNEIGAGEAAKATAFIGLDTPAAPTEVRLADNCDGTATLTWAAPSDKGAKGGYVDSEKLIYVVYSPSTTVVKDNITGTETTLSLTNTGDQQEKSFYIGARYADTKVTNKAQSNSVLAGAPYTVPYKESFAGAEAGTKPWIKEVVSGKSYDTSWAARPDQVHDGDGGAADMTGNASGAASRWASPKIDISTAVAPTLKAYVLMPYGNMAFELQIQKDYGEWITLESVDEATEWKEITADLTAHKAKTLRIGLLGKCLKDINFVYVDNLSVTDGTGSVDNINSDDAAIEVIGNVIHVSAAGASNVMVAGIDGRVIYSDIAADAAVEVANGLYIVTVGNRSTKVIVK